MLISFLQLFLLSFGFNTLPEFVPPTSLLLSYFYIKTGDNVFLLAVITVFGAVLGRIVLYFVSRYFGKKLFSENVHRGYALLRKIIHKNDFVTILFMTLYCISPLSTSIVFIFGGVAQIKLWPIIIGFIFGRFIQYVFIALTVSNIFTSLQDIIGKNLLNPISIGFSILGIIIAGLLLTLDWENLLLHKKISFYKKVFK